MSQLQNLRVHLIHVILVEIQLYIIQHELLLLLLLRLLVLIVVVVSWHELVVEVVLVQLVVVVQVHMNIVLMMILGLALFLEYLRLILKLLHQLLAELFFVLVVDVEMRLLLAVPAPILLAIVV